jgi:transposase
MDLELPAALRPIVTAYEATVRETTAALKALDDRLTQRAEADPRIARLQSIPGVGRISAQTLVAAVDRIERFPTAKKLVAYSGLVPSVRASGERVEYGRITKEGRSEIRGVWVQAAHAVLAVKGTAARPLQQWCDRITKRRGKKTVARPHDVRSTPSALGGVDHVENRQALKKGRDAEHKERRSRDTSSSGRACMRTS